MVAETRQTCDGPLVAGEDLKSDVPILFVKDVSASAAFFREKLRFKIDFLYGTPPFYSSVSRGHRRSQN